MERSRRCRRLFNFRQLLFRIAEELPERALSIRLSLNDRVSLVNGNPILLNNPPAVIRWFPRVVPRFHCGLVLVLVLTLSQGCGRKNRSLTFPTETEMPTLLLSEVLAAEDRSRLGACVVEIENPGSEPRDVKLLRTGCTCYGFSLDGKQLKKGDTATIPAGAKGLAEIRFQPAINHSDKSYTADLAFLEPGGKSRAASMKCRLKIISDVRLTPGMLTLDVRNGEPASKMQTVTIRHSYRSEDGTAPRPEFPDLPAEAEILDLKESGEPEEIERGLWQQTWKAKMKIEIPADHAGFPPSRQFLVAFPDHKGGRVTGQGTIALHSRQKVVFPNRVHFGKVPVGQSRMRRVFLTNTEDGLFHIRIDPASLPEFVTVQFNDYGDQRHLVELTVHPQQPGPFSETIVLTTDLYDVSEIEIRLEGVAAPRSPRTESSASEEGSLMNPGTPHNDSTPDEDPRPEPVTSASANKAKSGKQDKAVELEKQESPSTELAPVEEGSRSPTD